MTDNQQTDEVREAFEQWARLSPPLLLDRDGDGEYECPQARWMWRTWEVAFKKGAFAGAASMQKQCDADYDALAATTRYEAALREAREALRTCRLFAGCEREYDEQAVTDALASIDNLLGGSDDVR